MEYKISATELARRLGDVLGKIRYRGDSFLVERNGAPIARIGPLSEATGPTLGDAIAAWTAAAEADDDFASDLERVGVADTEPESPWDS